MQFGRAETQDNTTSSQETQTAVNTTTKHNHNKLQSISGHYMPVGLQSNKTSSGGNRGLIDWEPKKRKGM